MPTLNKRIWELDFVRGFAILCVAAVHFTNDLKLFAELPLEYPQWFVLIKKYGGILFVFLSGLCATLGSRSFKRGALVFAAGVCITITTFSLCCLGPFDESVLVQWGVLHLIGFCMMLYPAYKNAPEWLIFIFAAVCIMLGPWMKSILIESHWFCPLGIRGYHFKAYDYFPIFPHLGYFMLGVVFGKIVYFEKKTLLPKVNDANPVIRFFCWCGRQSLWIYLIHMPLFIVITYYLF